MGYPLVGAEATIVSWGSTNFYSVLLAAISPHTANFQVITDDHDVTGLGGTSRTTLPGLYRSRVSIRSRWNSTPKLGNVGFVSVSSAGTITPYTTHVKAFELTFRSANVHDITEYVSATGSAPVFRSFRPDYLTWSGTYTAMADSATALAANDLPTSTLNTLLFRYGAEGTNDTLSGTAQISQLSQTIQVGSISETQYSFIGSGALTPAGTTSPFGSSALGIPAWSQGGSAVGAMVLKMLEAGGTDRQATIADTFYESITVRCEVGSPVEIDVEVVGTGAVTFT